MSGITDDDITTADSISFEAMNAPTPPGEHEGYAERTAAELEAVFDVPVRISVVRSARPSKSSSTIAWWRAAKSCWSKAGSASP
jgi:hypothetical protein